MSLALVPVALLLLLFLPGFLSLRGPLMGLPGQARAGQLSNATFPSPQLRQVDLMELAGLSIFLSFLLSSVTSFVLVMLGIFSLWLLLSILAIYSLVLLGKYYRQLGLARLIEADPVVVLKTSLVATVFILGALVLYSKPAESLLLFSDPGAYVNSAVNISKTGSSLIPDELFYSLNEGLQKSLVYEHPVDVEAQAGRLDGFQVEYRLRGYTKDPLLSHTTSQFFNLFPTWGAIAATILPLKGVLWVAPVSATLSVLFIFLLGRRLFGGLTGFSAACLLSVNMAQLWYAKTPVSETTYQMTFLGACFAWAVFSATKRRSTGIVAGAGFGALALLRVDSVLIIFVVGGFLLYLLRTGRTASRDWYFVVPLVGIATLGMVDALYTSRPYLQLTYKAVLEGLPGPVLASMGAFAIVTGAAAIAAPAQVATLLRRIEATHADRIRKLVGLAIVVLAMFAYFVRPMVDQNLSWSGTGSIINSSEEHSFVRLGWYLSVPGLVAAVFGAVLAVIRGTNRALVLFLLVGLTVTAYYLYKPSIRPEHFWAARRYVPVIIPMALLFIGLVIQTSGSWLDHVRHYSSKAKRSFLPLKLGHPSTASTGSVRGIAGTVRKLTSAVSAAELAYIFLGALIGLSVVQVWGFVPYQDQEGSFAQIERMANKFPEDAVIVFEHSALGDALAPAIKLVHGRETFVIGPPDSSDWYRTLCGQDERYPSSDEPESCILHELAAATDPSPLYWITEGPRVQPRFVLEQFELAEQQSFTITIPLIERTLDRLPKASNTDYIGFEGRVYRYDRQLPFPVSSIATRAVSPSSVLVTWSHGSAEEVGFHISKEGVWSGVETGRNARTWNTDLSGHRPALPNRTWLERILATAP